MIDMTGIGFLIMFGAIAALGVLAFAIVAVVCLNFGWHLSGWAILGILGAIFVAGIIGGTIVKPKVWR